MASTHCMLRLVRRMRLLVLLREVVYDVVRLGICGGSFWRLRRWCMFGCD